MTRSFAGHQPCSALSSAPRLIPTAHHDRPTARIPGAIRGPGHYLGLARRIHLQTASISYALLPSWPAAELLTAVSFHILPWSKSASDARLPVIFYFGAGLPGASPSPISVIAQPIANHLHWASKPPAPTAAASVPAVQVHLDCAYLIRQLTGSAGRQATWQMAMETASRHPAHRRCLTSQVWLLLLRIQRQPRSRTRLRHDAVLALEGQRLP